MKKRNFRIITGLFVLLLSLVLIFPLFFKSKIKELVLKEFNSQVNADIEIGSFHLNILKTFPDFYASFQDIQITGKDDFQGDTLVIAQKIGARIDLPSVFSDEIIMEKLSIDGVKVSLLINQAGLANYDIEKEKNAGKSTESSAIKKDKKPLKFKLENIAIRDFDFIYKDKKANYFFSFENLDGTLTGALEGMEAVLNLDLHVPLMNLQYDSVRYLNNEHIDLVSILNADLENYVFEFQEGGSNFNGVPLIVAGGFKLIQDSIDFNIDFSVPDIEMKTVLEEIPDTYKKYIKDVETDGDVSFTGGFKGIYYGDNYPAFSIDFVVKNGFIQYPQLPDRLKINELKASVTKPQGILDKTRVGISNLDASLAGNPIRAKAVFSSLLSDPSIDVVFDGVVDLKTLSSVVPMGQTNLSGMLTANATINGKYSDIETNNYQSFVSDGIIELDQFYIENPELPQGLSISQGSIELDKQRVLIKRIQAKMGQSDFTLTGGLDNIVNWLFTNEELKGRFRSQSTLLNLNEFMGQYKGDETVENEVYIQKDTTIADAFLELPGNMHLIFDASARWLYFDQMDISNFKGNIELRDKALALNNLSMNLVGGQLKMDGTLVTKAETPPFVNLKLDLKRIDLKEASTQISMIKRYLPFASKSQGQFSTNLKMQSTLNKSMGVDFSELDAGGTFQTHDLKLVDANLMKSLRSVIKIDQLRNIEVDDFTAAYTMRNGNLEIKPFRTQVAQQEVRLGGMYNLGGTVDFRVDANVDKTLLSNEIQNMIAYIPGHQKVNKIDVGLDISGDAKKPDVKVDTDKIKDQVMKSLRNSSSEELEDAAKKLLQQLFK